MLLDSNINVDKKYYTKVFLKERKYTMKNKNKINPINEELDES